MRPDSTADAEPVMTGSVPVVVTGTGTDVGKTVATAALAALARSAGVEVGICKPVQTGLEPGEPGDAHEAARLAGVDRILEVSRFPHPLAPETAARVAGLPPLTSRDLVPPIRQWLGGAGPAADEVAGRGRLDLIEGAGGVLVRLGVSESTSPCAGAASGTGSSSNIGPIPSRGLTVLDMARDLAAPVVVVARAGLGTLSDSELAIRAIHDAGLRCAGIVVGAWPGSPGLAERCNLDDLPRLTGVPVLGQVPCGAGSLQPADFQRMAPGWFTGQALARLSGNKAH